MNSFTITKKSGFAILLSVAPRLPLPLQVECAHLSYLKLELWGMLAAITRNLVANKIILTEINAIEKLCALLATTTEPAVECETTCAVLMPSEDRAAG
jgi:hypothetical protein